MLKTYIILHIPSGEKITIQHQYNIESLLHDYTFLKNNKHILEKDIAFRQVLGFIYNLPKPEGTTLKEIITEFVFIYKK